MRPLRFGRYGKATEANKRAWRKFMERRRGIGILTRAARDDTGWILAGWDDVLVVDLGIKPHESLTSRNDANDIK